MNKFLFLVSVVFLGGCLTTQDYSFQDDESDDYSEDSDTSQDLDGYEKPNKEVDTCGNSYTYHTIIFNEKSYFIKLPIPCSQEPYIEKGTPSELDDTFDKHSITTKTISY